MSRFLHRLFQYALFILLEELLVGLFGIDDMIENAIPWAAPYLYPWGVIVLLGIGYIYFRFWLDKRAAPDVHQKTSQERKFPLWLAPLVYLIIWFNKFHDWAYAGDDEDDDPARDARIIFYNGLIFFVLLSAMGLLLQMKPF